ncbi:MAG: hypothetical protein MJ231_06610 [bacterium]|nr:hypothetical protein [bacterium]
MTITLLDLYNSAATQEWAMYDNDATSGSEFEDSLVLALNKAILEIFSSYDFPFRERTHLILTIPKVDTYDAPQGLIKKDSDGNHLVKYNSAVLKHIENPNTLNAKIGTPQGFYLKNSNIVLYPIPAEKGIVTIDYSTLAIGENTEGKEIYSLKNDTDTLSVPVYLEELVKEAIITKTMLNTIASETDENYSAYKKQADKAYKLLIKYSKGVVAEKNVKI